MIVKALPFMGTADELMKIFNVFPKEIRMYAEIIPKFEALFHEFGEAVQFGPKCVLVLVFYDSSSTMQRLFSSISDF